MSGELDRLAQLYLNPLPGEGTYPESSPDNTSAAQSRLDRISNAKLKQHMAAKFVGWLAVGGGIKALSSMFSPSADAEVDKTVKSYVKARNPVVDISVDEDQDKEAGTGLGRFDRNTLHLAGTGAALLGGFYVGWELVDKIQEKLRAKQLQKQIDKTDKEIQDLASAEYVRTRGLNKKATEDTNVDVDTDSYWRTAKSLYAAAALAMFALTATGTKNYYDKRDPNRKKLSDFKKLLNQRAQQKDAPVLFETTSKPSSGTLKAKKGSMAGKVTLPSKTEQKHTTTSEVDESDPYADLLKG